MDIHKWLDETVLPARPPSSPSLPDQRSPVPFLPPRPSDTLLKGRRRKRSTSDSSLLHARTAPRRSPPMRRPADTARGRDNASACSDADEPDHSSESSMSGQQYARKPRRKTRPERYEPASKDANRRGTQHCPHEKGESKKVKKRSRRKKAEKPGAGLVQSFHAKNVPQDRLTLKPREKLGLFNKGRVSLPVKGRGLPDLVFSEMRFLQKHGNQPEAVPEAGLPRGKRKKDHADAKQDDISAYFTTVRPTLAEKDVNIQAREGALRQSLSRGGSAGRERLSRLDNTIPTVEPPDKAPCLGSGSRSMRHDSGSYVSWSESVRAPSAAPMPVQAGSTITGQLGSMPRKENRLDVVGGDMLHSRTPPSTFRHFTSGSGECFHVSSLTPANHRGHRSHSVPQRNGSASLHGFEESSKGRGAIERTISAPMMPAETPHSSKPRHERKEGAGAKPALEHGRDGYSSKRHSPIVQDSDAEDGHINSSMAANGDPQTSSTLGRLLRECNSAFDEHRAQESIPTEPDRTLPHLTATIGKEQRLADTGPYGNIRSLPTVRFSGVETRRPVVPSYSRLNIYEEQERRNRANQPQSEEDLEEEHTWQGFSFTEDGVDFAEELDEWNYACEESELRGVGAGTMAGGLQVESPMESIFEPYEAGNGEGRLGQSEDVVASGFWRPHKLY